MLKTDYLVVGAGAASMAFIDTLITEQPDIHITVVDKHSAPGGHWNDAYGYVRLHQPSLLYGVSSEQLEGSWTKLMLSKFTLPWKHRATKTELLKHYKIIMDKWIAQKKVSYYPNCVYNFEEKPDPSSNDDIHTFMSLDGSRSYKIQVNVKLVNGVLGECKVPSQHAPEFHIDKGVSLVTPNDIYDFAHDKSQRKIMKDKKYVVLGCGKTAMDAVIFLQRNLKINADNITWIIPNDVWMIHRLGPGLPSTWPEALLEHDFDAEKAALSLEKKGALVRLDPQVTPTKYRFAVIGKNELSYMRKVKNIVRQGRVTSLTVDSNDAAVLSFQKGNNLNLNRTNHVFVHCTSPGPFNDNTIVDLFPSEKEINLWLLFAPPVPVSMSCIAVLESRRRNGSLDIEFAREILHLLKSGSGKEEKLESSPLTSNQVLNELIRGYNITGADSVMGSSASPLDQVDTLLVTALFFGLLDKDPLVAHNWMSSNRLSVLTIPGVKSGVYESVCAMLKKSKLLGLDKGNVKMLSLLGKKLKVLEGK